MHGTGAASMAAVSSSARASSTTCKLIRTQDHRPQVSLSAIVATSFIESGEERLQTGLMQAEEVILARFTDQFLVEGDGHQLAVRKTWGVTRPLQGVLDHC